MARGVKVCLFSENTQDAEYARLNRRAFADDALLQPIDMRVTGDRGCVQAARAAVRGQATGGICGNAYGSSIYGELTVRSMREVRRALQKNVLV